MKRIVASLLSVASAAYLFPMAFPHVVAGCNNPNYTFRVGTLNVEQGAAAAKLAKAAFCKAAGKA